MYIMFKISNGILLFIFVLTLNVCQGNDKYIPPSNIQHPFGDEQEMISDLLGDTTNIVTCRNNTVSQFKEANCPSITEDQNLKGIYVPCPDNFPSLNQELLYTSNELEIPQVQCKKCNLRVTSDKQSVIVECFHCFDISLAGKQGIEKKILYKTFYLQIPSYSSKN